MDLIEVKKVVSRIKGNLFKNSNSYSIGMMKSHFRGHGLQFKEHQVYNHGDDTRFIDWKIFAKMNTPYIKTFEEERNIEIVVVIDASPSMLLGHNGVSKLQSAIEICCLLYLLSEQTKDFVHAIILGDEVINLPKENGNKGITRLITTLERNNITKNGKINRERMFEEDYNIDRSINHLFKHLKRRRELVILSDFSEVENYKDIQKIFKRHHVHCFQLLSPIELNKKMPFTIRSTINNKKNIANAFTENEELQDLIGEKFKIKTLKVHERYLEEFIKEML